jgi:hypothetical protein
LPSFTRRPKDLRRWAANPAPLASRARKGTNPQGYFEPGLTPPKLKEFLLTLLFGGLNVYHYYSRFY